MRKPFAMGRLTRETAEIVILERERSVPEPWTRRTLRALVRLSGGDRGLDGGSVH